METNKDYVAYLLTDYIALDDPYECEANIIPLKVVQTKQEAYDFLVKRYGQTAIWGIESDGNIIPVLADADSCGYYLHEEQEVREHYFRTVKYILKIN